jgi:hypothetical protein
MPTVQGCTQGAPVGLESRNAMQLQLDTEIETRFRIRLVPEVPHPDGLAVIALLAIFVAVRVVAPLSIDMNSHRAPQSSQLLSYVVRITQAGGFANSRVCKEPGLLTQFLERRSEGVHRLWGW